MRVRTRRRAPPVPASTGDRGGRSDRRGLELNVPLIVAGSIAILGAAVHGVGGEALAVRKLSPGTLPSSPFGGPRATKAMIHVTWHLPTIAFLTVGAALLLSGSVLDGDAAQGISLVAAYVRSPRSLLRHPGPAALTATALLAWRGAL